MALLVNYWSETAQVVPTLFLPFAVPTHKHDSSLTGPANQSVPKTSPRNGPISPRQIEWHTCRNRKRYATMRIRVKKVSPTYDTPFTHESEPWGARTLLSVQPRHPDIATAAEDSSSSSKASAESRTKGSPQSPLKVSVVSYNVLADSNSVRVQNCPPSVLNWGRRRGILLREIFSVRADVLCLQDVDSFHQWWGPQLTGAGYDSLFKQKTSRAAVHREGVVIAWKRDVFDLLRSEDMELNRLGEHEEDRLLAGKAATSDNVALMALLQPWQDSNYPTGACVVCTELFHEQGAQGDAVRSLQACSLTRTIEAFNSDFHLPIILCGTMNCAPSSGVYEILCRGVEAQDPSQPGPPGKPIVEPLSTSTALVRWTVPQEDSEFNPAVDLYNVLWVPGGSRFLSGESVGVRESDCVVYDLVETEEGKFKSEQNPLRSFTVTGLSSGVAYEFRVAAVNCLGQGPWSERSEPVCMPRMAGNDPETRVLLGVASIKLIRNKELEEARRRAAEKLAGPRAYEIRKLVKVDGMVDLLAEKLHPFDSVSGMTPRYSDAVLHPYSANVRTDNGFPIMDLAPRRRSSGGVVCSTAGRRRRRRPNKGAGGHVDLDTTLSVDDDTGSTTAVSHDEQSAGDASGSVPEANVEGGDGGSSQSHISGNDASLTRRSEARNTEPNGCGTKIGAHLDLCASPPPCGRVVPKVQWFPKPDSGREAGVLLRLAALNVSGARSERQKHALGLRSAYMSYSSGGEPAFTTISNAMSGTADYIFFSANCLLPLEVLSLPEMGSLEGRDVQQTELAPAPGSKTPKDWQLKPSAQGFRGEWLPYLRENSKIVRHQIPNDRFPSDHIMLMANMLYFEPRCPSTWGGKKQ